VWQGENDRAKGGRKMRDWFEKKRRIRNDVSDGKEVGACDLEVHMGGKKHKKKKSRVTKVGPE